MGRFFTKGALPQSLLRGMPAEATRGWLLLTATYSRSQLLKKVPALQELGVEKSCMLVAARSQSSAEPGSKSSSSCNVSPWHSSDKA